MLVRPMRPADVPAATAVALQAFEIADEEASRARSSTRISHLLATDPDGAFVLERDGEVIGVALALLRERLWFLSLLTVRPDRQSTGAGRALMERVLGYGDATGPRMITSSDDPRAERLYRRTGFQLRPTTLFEGTLDRARLPAPHPEVRIAGQGDLDALAEISRSLRGAAHTPDLEFALAEGVVLLRLADRGLAAFSPGRLVLLLAAHDEEAASALLWHALELVGDSEEPLVRWVTAEQRWARSVARRAGLSVKNYGALAVRGGPGPLHPYLPWGTFG